MPYYPYTQDNTETHSYQYTVDSFWKQLVSEYTGLNFLQIGELNFLKYLTWRRDAYIRRLEQTESGREYLDNAWRMERTEPDRKSLRQKLKKE
ncbi:MAG: hypothetical protein K2H89_07605 [Oscillospiraceae bacterium]|nr:hypothetical protein [Oscillospiraceae bacterium]